jgi:hypothetical protein
LRTLYEVSGHGLTLDHGAAAKGLEPTPVLLFVALDDVRRHLSGCEGTDVPTGGGAGVDARFVRRMEAGTALPKGRAMVSLVGGQNGDRKHKAQAARLVRGTSRQPPAASRQPPAVKRKP